jgi:hypothetical protein
MSEESKSARLPLDEQFIQAIQRCGVDECRKLLNQGVDVNHKDRNGNTPIFHCSTPQHSKILRFLISAGANVNAVNVTGSSPLHYAAERGCMEIILILMLHGADPLVVNQNKQKAEDFSPKLKPMMIALTNDRHIYSSLTETYKKKLALIFDDIDRDGSGVLNLEKSMKFNRYMEDIPADIARRDAQDFLRDVGICHSGQVNLDEWLFSFAKLVHERGNEALDQVIEDYERTGKEKSKFEDFVPRD